MRETSVLEHSQSVILSSFSRIWDSTRRENCTQILWEKTNLRKSLPEGYVFFLISSMAFKASFWFEKLKLCILV